MPQSKAVAALLQLTIGLYGGYFGGGMGILMLATFSVTGMKDIHAMNALKTVLGVLINGVAVVSVNGALRRELSVLLHAQKLREYNISVAEVVGALRGSPAEQRSAHALALRALPREPPCRLHHPNSGPCAIRAVAQATPACRPSLASTTATTSPRV